MATGLYSVLLIAFCFLFSQVVCNDCGILESQFKDFSDKIPTSVQKVIDAEGKPEAGLLQGNNKWFGSFSECVSIPKMGYCLLDIELIFAFGNFSSPVLLEYGACIPESCTAEIAFKFLKKLAIKYHFAKDAKLLQYSWAHTDPVWPLDTGFWATLVFIVFILLLNVIGTIVARVRKEFISYIHADAYKSMSDEENEHVSNNVPPVELVPARQPFWIEMATAFSIPDNFSKLVNTSRRGDAIPCLDGLRVLSITWIILCHTFFAFLLFAPIRNLLSMLNITKNFLFSFIVSGFFSVDTFYFLSGFLLAYKLFKEFDNGKISWISLYVYRYVRLTPAMGFTILLAMYVFPFLGNGPTWQKVWSSYNRVCGTRWYTNLLYINNFYPNDLFKECIAWTWYLANDMQFFIISPPLLFLTYKKRLIGMCVIVLLLIGSFISSATLTITNKYDPVIRVGLNGTMAMTDYLADVYIKPYTRIQPYIVGLGFGYIMHTTNWRSVRAWYSYCFQFLSLITMLYIMICQYPYYHSGSSMGLAYSTIYITFYKGIWAVCISCLVYSCHTGSCWPIRKFLESKVWIPLSRLSYVVYLVHFLILQVIITNFQTPLDYNTSLLLIVFTTTVCLSFCLSLCISLLLEFPIMQCFKILQKGFRR